MSEKTSRKTFLLSSGTVLAGWLAYCGLRRGAAPSVVKSADAGRLPLEARPEPRAVPMRRV